MNLLAFGSSVTVPFVVDERFYPMSCCSSVDVADASWDSAKMQAVNQTAAATGWRFGFAFQVLIHPVGLVSLVRTLFSAGIDRRTDFPFSAIVWSSRSSFSDGRL